MSKEEDPNFEKIDAELTKIYELAKIIFDEGDYRKCLELLK